MAEREAVLNMSLKQHRHFCACLLVLARLITSCCRLQDKELEAAAARPAVTDSPSAEEVAEREAALEAALAEARRGLDNMRRLHQAAQVRCRRKCKGKYKRKSIQPSGLQGGLTYGRCTRRGEKETKNKHLLDTRVDCRWF